LRRNVGERIKKNAGGLVARTQHPGGRKVKVVQMTDGQAATHANLITRVELKKRRRQEALNAGRLLGLDEDDTYFLDYEDGRLQEYTGVAAKRILQILDQEQPDEVFLPYVREPLALAPDHVATTRIIMMALSQIRRQLTSWEYPVWFWVHWPWIGIRQGGRRLIPMRLVARNSLRELIGLRAFIELRHSVDIGDVLDRKRAALAKHRSQMQRIVDDSRWLTLGQIASGEFLACFDYPREFFRRSELKSN
jgi:LmbE family N-acetylglucosaminyl deacetylase